MSSVKSPGERSQNDDQIRRTRETYQQREADTAKKQSQKLRTLSEAHAEELEQVRAQHGKQLDEIKEKTSDAVSRRDVQYLKEIDEMREMHQKQLQRVSGDAEMRQDRSEGALKSEKKRVLETTAQQREILKNSYEEQLRSSDKRFSEFTGGALKTQAEDLKASKEKLKQAHGKELATVIKDRDERIGSQQRQSREVSRTKDEQIKDLKTGKQNESNRLMANHSGSITNERENHKQALDMQREELNDGLKQNRDRYEKATEKLRLESQGSSEGLSQTVNGRLNSQVRQLEESYQNLKDQQPRIRVKNEQQKARELSNLRSAMTENIEQLEDSRLQVVDATNEKTHQELGRINKSNSELINRTNKFYQDKIAMDGLRAEERVNRSEADSRKVLSQEVVSNDTRFDKLKNSHETEQGKMRAFFERATGAMRENFDNTLRDMRERNKRDQEIMFKQFAASSQESDAKFQQKIAEISSRYEKQIADVQEVNLKDSKESQTVADRQRAELKKKSEVELQSQASQYQYRIAKSEETHKRELEAMQRRHEESLANLTKNRQA